MHYTYVPGSCPQLFGWSKFIFFINLGLCIILMCPGRVLSSSASRLLFSSPTLVYALYLCARIVSSAVRPVQIYFLYQPRSMHYTYVPMSCHELFGWSIIIFVTNLGLCIILMHPGHILGYSAETNLFSVQTSMFFLLVKYFTEQVIQVSIFVQVRSNIIFLKYLQLFTLSI